MFPNTKKEVVVLATMPRLGKSESAFVSGELRIKLTSEVGPSNSYFRLGLIVDTCIGRRK